MVPYTHLSGDENYTLDVLEVRWPWVNAIEVNGPDLLGSIMNKNLWELSFGSGAWKNMPAWFNLSEAYYLRTGIVMLEEEDDE